MDDDVFKQYERIMNFLSDDEKVTFKLGFRLGISEGTARCTAKLSKHSYTFKDEKD